MRGRDFATILGDAMAMPRPVAACAQHVLLMDQSLSFAVPVEGGSSTHGQAR